jgi:hypothetical protein
VAEIEEAHSNLKGGTDKRKPNKEEEMADTKKPSMSQLRKKLQKAAVDTKPTAAQLQSKYKKKTATKAATAPAKKAAAKTTTKATVEAKPQPTASSKVSYRPPRVKKKDIQFLPTFSKAQQDKIKEGTVQDPNSSDSLKRREFRDWLALYLDAMTTKQIASMAKKYKVDSAKIASYQKLKSNGLKRMNTGNTIRKAINSQLAA